MKREKDGMKMNVLIACEESQRVCTAFRERGHEAFSCDILDCSGGHPEWHIKGDCLPLLNGNCEFTTADTHTHTARTMGLNHCTSALHISLKRRCGAFIPKQTRRRVSDGQC